MKRIIAGMIGAAVLGGAVVAQEVTFWNRLGSRLVTQDASKDSSASFGYIYDRIVGQYDAENFSFFGRAQFMLKSGDKWKHNVEFTSKNPAGFIEFNGAMRPLPFLELALGNSYGAELPWAGYELPGAYGYGSDVSYGRRKWADGEGFTVLFKGEGIGVDGLYIGWNAIPEQTFSFKENDRNNGWDTQVGVIYNLDGMLGIGVGGKFTTRKGEEGLGGKDIDPNQQIGVYLEFTGMEGLKVGAGVTVDTNGTAGFDGSGNDATSTFTDGKFDFLPGLGNVSFNRGVNAFVNVGAEYSLEGMGLPLTVGADAGLYAIPQTVQVVSGQEDLKALPLLAGLLLTFDLTDQLWVDLRTVYEDALLSGGGSSYEGYGRSRLTITPRVYFLLTEADALRLDVPIVTNFVPERDGSKYTRKGYAGFSIDLFWQHHF